jgi:hypothetical protein
MARVICTTCGVVFQDKRPQDPALDKGYGTCSECRAERAIVLHNLHPHRFPTLHAARERIERYA